MKTNNYKVITFLVIMIIMISIIPIRIYEKYYLNDKTKINSEKPKYEILVSNVKYLANNTITIDEPVVEEEIIEEPIIEETIYKTYSLSNSDYNLFLRVVASEANYGSYEDSLAVASNILNRCESKKWSRYPNGTNPIAQIKRPNQYTVYASGAYKHVKVSEETKKAVNDALNGKRSHNLLSFRSNSSNVYSYVKGYGVTYEEYQSFKKEEINEIIIDGIIVLKRFDTKGNLFFNPMEETDIII